VQMQIHFCSSQRHCLTMQHIHLIIALFELKSQSQEWKPRLILNKQHRISETKKEDKMSDYAYTDDSLFGNGITAEYVHKHPSFLAFYITVQLEFGIKSIYT